TPTTARRDLRGVAGVVASARRRTMRILAAVPWMVAGVLAAGPVAAGERAGVSLPDRITVETKTLTLNGMGLREATWLKVDVYVAGLYLETRSSDPEAIIASEQTKRLVMRFVRAVDRDALLKGWNEGFENSAGPSAAVLRDRIATFESWVSDM